MRTEEQIARDDQLLADQRFQIWAELNDKVASDYYLNGLRVPITVYPDKLVYIFALPWARGWAIFVSDKPDSTIQDWRNVSDEFKHLQEPLYAPRGQAGPHNVSNNEIVRAIQSRVSTLVYWSVARVAAFNKKHWYWPRSCYARV